MLLALRGTSSSSEAEGEQAGREEGMQRRFCKARASQRPPSDSFREPGGRAVSVSAQSLLPAAGGDTPVTFSFSYLFQTSSGLSQAALEGFPPQILRLPSFPAKLSSIHPSIIYYLSSSIFIIYLSIYLLSTIYLYTIYPSLSSIYTYLSPFYLYLSIHLYLYIIYLIFI